MAWNFGDILDSISAVLPQDAPALIHGDRVITWGETTRRSNNLGRALIARGAGHVSLISSVAGFRGLPKSLAYGPTKAALTNLAENLYLDMEPLGVGVSVIHPGFVQTPLTAQNKFTMPALITPEQAAQATIAGWAKGEFEIHYPKRFTHVMKLLRLLPYRAYFPAVRRATGL